MAFVFRILALCLTFSALASGADPSIVAELPFSSLSDRNISVSGRYALGLHPEYWKHGETGHFVLHFIQNYVADAVASEAEFYFDYLVRDLAIDPASRTGKSHIYIFEDRDDWKKFLETSQLEKWTGAVTIGNEVFIPRNPEVKFKGHALGHEIVHLMVHRFVGTKLPLWLEEGYAEDASMTAYGAYYRCRGYEGVLPRDPLTSFLPLAHLTSLTAYPAEPEVDAFYTEANWLTYFLSGAPNQKAFMSMFQAMAKGSSFESARSDAYGSQWSTLSDLEHTFKEYYEKACGQRIR